MRIADLVGESDVATADELEAALRRRLTNESNAFDLSFPGREFPQLLLHIKGELAFAYYLPGGGHAGFISTGSNAPYIPGEGVNFPISEHGDQIEVLKRSLISLAAILATAKEFFASDGQLPRCIEWEEL